MIKTVDTIVYGPARPKLMLSLRGILCRKSYILRCTFKYCLHLLVYFDADTLFTGRRM